MPKNQARRRKNIPRWLKIKALIVSFLYSALLIKSIATFIDSVVTRGVFNVWAFSMTLLLIALVSNTVNTYLIKRKFKEPISLKIEFLLVLYILGKILI